MYQVVDREEVNRNDIKTQRTAVCVGTRGWGGNQVPRQEINSQDGFQGYLHRENGRRESKVVTRAEWEQREESVSRQNGDPRLMIRSETWGPYCLQGSMGNRAPTLLRSTRLC